MQDTYVKDTYRIIWKTIFFSFQVIPVAFQVHAEIMQAVRWIGRIYFNYPETFIKFFKKTIFIQSIQIFHDPVIIHNMQFIRRE